MIRPTSIREIRPQSGPQSTFLASRADIVVYGGAAGGGKSWALLVEPLRHVRNPSFGAVIFRRTSPQITNEGGLWDESATLYPLFGAVPKVGTLDWEFPGGANVGMRHLQHEMDKLAWQGSQVPLIEFDELTHFSESQFFYMLSRNRSTCGVRPYIRATTNPDATSWVKRFLAPWLERGHPLTARSGEVRWFIRVDGEILWAITPDSLRHRYPNRDPKSVTFIFASVFDNKILLAKDPGYLANLQALPPVDRARLLEGNWDVKNEGLVYPEFSSCIVAADVPVPEGRPVGGIDFGWNNPFAALWGVLADDVLWITGERYGSKTAISEHSRHLPRGGITWWADPAGADQIAELRRADHHVRPCVHRGPKPIMTGIDRVSHRIRTKRLKVSEVCANLLREADLYHYDPDKLKEEPVDADNHALAALRYLIVGLDRGKAIDEGAPGPTDAEKAEQAAREQAERDQAQQDWMRLDNPFWWTDS